VAAASADAMTAAKRAASCVASRMIPHNPQNHPSPLRVEAIIHQRTQFGAAQRFTLRIST
jgi:hypothetical protein